MFVSTVAVSAVAFGIPLLAVPPPEVGPLPDRCVTESPCVFIHPPVDPWSPPAGAVVTYHGRGWQPREEIEASWGSYCPPAVDCLGVGRGTRFRADARGRFVFRLRHGTRPPAGPGPKGAGSESVIFASWTRAAENGEALRREGVFPPPPSRARQRREARQVAAAVRAYARRLVRLRPRTVLAMDRHNDEVARCQDLLRTRSAAERRVVDRVTDAAIATASWNLSSAPRLAFANQLASLGVRDDQVRAGVEAWVRAARRPQWAPRPGLCAELRRWRAAGSPLADPPLAPSQPLLQEQITGSFAVELATRRLLELRADEDAADAFSGGVFDLTRYVDP